jgi:hypothetical protein
MSPISHDSSRTARCSARVAPQAPGDGWIKPSHGKGLLKPWRKGETGRVSNIASRYVETQRLCREHSLEAVQALIGLLHDPDGRIVAVADNPILERAWGKTKEMKPEDVVLPSIDLSKLTGEELRILLALADGGRLTSAPGPGDEAPVIDAKAEPARGK